jgi:hypothetical protein
LGEIGVVGGECCLDILADERSVIPQRRTELGVGKLDRIVLCRQHGIRVPGVRPQQRERHGEQRHASHRRNYPRPLHPEKPSVSLS